MFEKATRQKLRFNYRGQLSVEDLWDLDVEVLDKMYSALRTEQKSSQEDSLLKKQTKANTTLNLKVDVIKHIVGVKVAEANARKQRAEKKLQKEKIASIIQKKQDEGLESMSIKDLQKAMDELEG